MSQIDMRNNVKEVSICTKEVHQLYEEQIGPCPEARTVVYTDYQKCRSQQLHPNWQAYQGNKRIPIIPWNTLLKVSLDQSNRSDMLVSHYYINCPILTILLTLIATAVIGIISGFTRTASNHFQNEAQI